MSRDEAAIAELRLALLRAVRRKKRGSLGELHRRLVTLGWLAPHPRDPRYLELTIAGERELCR